MDFFSLPLILQECYLFTKIPPREGPFMQELWVDYQMGMLLKPASMVNASGGSCCPAALTLILEDYPLSKRISELVIPLFRTAIFGSFYNYYFPRNTGPNIENRQKSKTVKSIHDGKLVNTAGTLDLLSLASHQQTLNPDATFMVKPVAFFSLLIEEIKELQI